MVSVGVEMASGDDEANTVRNDKKKRKRRQDSTLEDTVVDNSSEKVISTENNMPFAISVLAETPINNGSELAPEVDLHNEDDSQVKGKRKKKKKQKVDLHNNVSELGPELDLHNEDDSQVKEKREKKKKKQKDDNSNSQNKECMPKGDVAEIDMSVATEGCINKRSDPEGERLSENFDEKGTIGPDKTERSLKTDQNTVDNTMQQRKKKKRSRGDSPSKFIDEGNCSKQDVSLTENTPSESGMFAETPRNNESGLGSEVDLSIEDESLVKRKRNKKKKRHMKDEKESPSKSDATERDSSLATEGVINIKSDPERDTLTKNFDEKGNKQPDQTAKDLKIDQRIADNAIQRPKKKKKTRENSSLNAIDEGNSSEQVVSLTENNAPLESGAFTGSQCYNGAELGPEVDLCNKDDSQVKEKRKKKKKKKMKDNMDTRSESDVTERDLSLEPEGVVNRISDPEEDIAIAIFSEEGNIQRDQTEGSLKIDQSAAENTIQRRKKKKKSRGDLPLDAFDVGNSSQEVSLIENNTPLESGALTGSQCDNRAELGPEVDLCDKDDCPVKDKGKKKKKKPKKDKSETQSECGATERDLSLAIEGVVNRISDPEEDRTIEIFSEEGNIQLDQVEVSPKINQNAAENTIQRRKKKKSRGDSPLDAVDVGNSSQEVSLIENNTPMTSGAYSESNHHKSELVLGENLFNKDDSREKKKRKKEKERHLLDADIHNERTESPSKNGVIEGDSHLASKDDDSNEKTDPESVKLESSYSHVERREKNSLPSEMNGDSSRSCSTNVMKKCDENGETGLSMVENGNSKPGQMESLANDQNTLDNSTQPRKKKRKSRQDPPMDAIGVSTDSKEVSLLEKCSETPSNYKSELDLGEDLSNNNNSQVKTKRIKKKKRQATDIDTDCERKDSPSKNGFIERDLCHTSEGDPKGAELLDSSRSHKEEKVKNQRLKLVSTEISGLEAAKSDSVKIEGNTLLSGSNSDVIYRCDENGKSALSLAEVRNIRPDPMQKWLRNRMSADSPENTGSPFKVAGQSSTKSSAGMDALVIVDNKLEKVAVDKKLLVLDLNGILVDVVSGHVDWGYKHDFKLSNKFVFKRPFCDDFLQFCFKKFDVGVWSSRTKENVSRLVDRLMGDSRQKLLFCWDQSHCTRTGFSTLENRDKPLFLKEIRKLWEHLDSRCPWIKYNETNTLLLDDSPYKALRNPSHTAIFPYSYSYRNTGDSSLGQRGKIRMYLQRLANAENVQDFVAQNPFGQASITESNPSWEFYSKIVHSDTCI